MKTTLMTLLLCFLAFAFAVQAQDKPNGEPSEKPAAEQTRRAAEKLTAGDYKDLLDKLKMGDTRIDFVKLRLAYTETKDYSPYGGSEERNAMYQALGQKDFKNALKLAEEMLKTNYVDLTGQFVAFRANAELGNTKEAEFHKKVFWG